MYVIFPDSAGTSWRVQSVPLSEGSFSSRLPLPEPWRGLRNDQLADIIHLPNAFVHATGFLGGTKSRDDAIAFAHLALTYYDDLQSPPRKKICMPPPVPPNTSVDAPPPKTSATDLLAAAADRFIDGPPSSNSNDTD